MLAWFTFVLCCLNGEWPFNNLYNMQPKENLKNHIKIISKYWQSSLISFQFHNLYPINNQQNLKNHVKIISKLSSWILREKIIFFKIIFKLNSLKLKIFYILYLTNQQNCHRQCPYWAPEEIELLTIISVIFNWWLSADYVSTDYLMSRLIDWLTIIFIIYIWWLSVRLLD